MPYEHSTAFFAALDAVGPKEAVRIEEITEPGFEFRFRIIDSSAGYEEKAYSREGAERIAREIRAKATGKQIQS